MPDSTENERTLSRFVVGIDLGTTNCAVAFVDTEDDSGTVCTFDVPQLVAAGEVEARETLPSFHYQPAAGEFAAGALRLPWGDENCSYIMGAFARDHGETVPGRQIGSAKSWLCHSGVDRTSPLLPWHGADDVEMLSPIDVSSRILAHIRAAWNHRFPEHPLEQQDVAITLPASFDEVARELTVKAAALAQLPRIVLLEEPQAAFYAWIYRHRNDWQNHVQPGQKILVCDVGGGTSDFTLIRVRPGSAGKVRFHRVAVGDHLILGGDNLDLALAHHVEGKLTAGGKKLSPRQWGVLVRTCRRAKEALLGANPPETFVINLPGGGSKLIGGGLQTEVSEADVRRILLDGFLPTVELNAQPSRRSSGFQEFGLPYAPDPAITRYLAAFLSAHRHDARPEEDDPVDHDPARPDIVVFNGGLFESTTLRERLLDQLSQWFSPGAGSDWQPLVLKNDRLDLAVAYGAAYYGMVRRGVGEKIAAGLPRTYYVGAESAENDETTAVCLLSAGIEDEQGVDLTDRTFHLRIREPVEFPIFVSSTRLTDQPGDAVPFDREQMSALPPIRTVLKSRSSDANILPVHLHARLTAIGTMDMWCSEVDGPRTWKLQFDVRAATHTDRDAHTGGGESAGFVDEQTIATCRALIQETFTDSGDPKSLVKRLAAAAGMSRHEWPPSLLREMWECLMEVEAGRKLSMTHEARWLNLLGYSLRPGFGMAVDDWRVAQTWRQLQGKLIHANPTCQAEFWILWRRIGGGLAAGQHWTLAAPLLAAVRNRPKSSKKKGKPSGGAGIVEVLRLLGSLESLSLDVKKELGTVFLKIINNEGAVAIREAAAWALGRAAARVPLHGPLNGVLAPTIVEGWIDKLLKTRDPDPVLGFTLMQLTRKTGDRYRDVSDETRQRVVDWLEDHDAPSHFVTLVREGGELEAAEQGIVFGESLPAGLRLG